MSEVISKNIFKVRLKDANGLLKIMNSYFINIKDRNEFINNEGSYVITQMSVEERRKESDTNSVFRWYNFLTINDFSLYATTNKEIVDKYFEVLEEIN